MIELDVILLDYYIDYKMLGSFMKEYNILKDFFKERDNKEIADFLIKRRDEYYISQHLGSSISLVNEYAKKCFSFFGEFLYKLKNSRASSLI